MRYASNSGCDTKGVVSERIVLVGWACKFILNVGPFSLSWVAIVQRKHPSCMLGGCDGGLYQTMRGVCRAVALGMGWTDQPYKHIRIRVRTGATVGMIPYNGSGTLFRRHTRAREACTECLLAGARRRIEMVFLRLESIHRTLGCSAQEYI